MSTQIMVTFALISLHGLVRVGHVLRLERGSPMRTCMCAGCARERGCRNDPRHAGRLLVVPFVIYQSMFQSFVSNRLIVCLFTLSHAC
jgi:hypothetical protein